MYKILKKYEMFEFKQNMYLQYLKFYALIIVTLNLSHI